ncbi:13552_t:CDS:1, partial [Cetraspora pellucida]
EACGSYWKINALLFIEIFTHSQNSQTFGKLVEKRIGELLLNWIMSPVCPFYHHLCEDEEVYRDDYLDEPIRWCFQHYTQFNKIYSLRETQF